METTNRRDNPSYGQTGPHTGGFSETGYASGSSASGGGTPAGSPDAGSGGRAQEMGDRAQETLNQARDVAQETAGTVLHQAQDQAAVRLSNGLDQAADLVGSLSDAIDSVSRQLRESDQGWLAEYVGRAGHQLDNFSQYLDECDAADIVHDVEQIARRQPALFLGGAFGLGLLAARFLKSSAPRSRTNYPSRRTGLPRGRYSQTAAGRPAGYGDSEYRPATPPSGAPASGYPGTPATGPGLPSTGPDNLHDYSTGR